MARVVALFVLHPDLAVHFRALQRITGVSHRSLQLELKRLCQLGLISRESVGRTVVFSAVSDHPRWAALRELVREFATPADLLRVGLARVPGIAAAFIYGSFALGTDVHPASDVDVFVVGETLDRPETRVALSAELLEIAGLLSREVNVTRFTPQKLASRWQPGRSAQFVQSVLAGEKEWLIGNESSLRWLSSVTQRKRRAATTGRQVSPDSARVATRRGA